MFCYALRDLVQVNRARGEHVSVCFIGGGHRGVVLRGETANVADLRCGAIVGD
jgi:hypothetical protein